MALRPDLAIGLPFRVLRAFGVPDETDYIPPLQSVGYKRPSVKSTPQAVLLRPEECAATRGNP